VRVPFRRSVARPPDAPEAAAAYWSARRRLGLSGARDEAMFAAWLKDPLNAAAFAAVERAMDAAGEFASDPAVEAMRRQARAVRPGMRRAAAWIAGLLVLAAAAVLIWRLRAAR
jgi:ferric-dicitrate binding protein FerR (iron transport regulator)